jgi:hypothetical protein
MVRGKIAGVAVLIAALAAPAASEARIYDAAGECALREGIADFDRVERARDYETYGTRSTRDVAERAAALIRGRRIWSTYLGHFGQPRREAGTSGAPLRFRIFLTDERLVDSDGPFAGTVVPYCDNPAADAAIVDATLAGDELPSVVAHELFHAFANAAAGDAFGGWWAEATATWGEVLLARNDRQVAQLDRQFAQRPQVPLDRELADPDFADHPYGAWRFVEWLEVRVGYGDPFWDFLAATFRRIAAPSGGEDNTRAVRSQLAAEDLALGELLGRFWGERLFPLNPLSGPATQGRTDGFAAEDPVGPDELTETRDLVAKQLAADVVRLKLPPRSHVQRITISAERAPSGTFLWVQNGNDLEDWSAGDSASYCVGGSSPSTGAKAWPGRLPLAFTNGNSEPPRSPIAHVLTIRTGAEECDGFVSDPSAAVDESPVLELPDRCPDAPAGFRPPEGHTDYYVFRERITRVFESSSTWLRAGVAEVADRGLPRRAAGRLFARWFYCSSRRAREIDQMPEGDELLARWRRKYVALLRRVARRYERGDIGGAIGPISEAGLQYSQMIGRATAQDAATAE